MRAKRFWCLGLVLTVIAGVAPASSAALTPAAAAHACTDGPVNRHFKPSEVTRVRRYTLCLVRHYRSERGMSSRSSRYQKDHTLFSLEYATHQKGDSQFQKVVDRFAARMDSRCNGAYDVGLFGDDTGSAHGSTAQTPLKLSRAILRDGIRDRGVLGSPGAIAVAATRGVLGGNGANDAVAVLVSRFRCRR